MRNLAILAIVMISMASVVSALGVGIPYSSNYPLKLSPGESSEVMINLQNGESTETTVQLSIISGSEIASAPSGSYVLPPKSIDNYGLINLNIPSDAAIGTKYAVRFGVANVGTGATGEMIAVKMASEHGFVVEVVAPTPKSSEVPALSDSTLMIVGVIVVLIVLWVLFTLLNKKKKGR